MHSSPSRRVFECVEPKHGDFFFLYIFQCGFLCLHHVKRDFAHLFALVAMHHGRIIRRVVSIEAI
jgi:hypothetical protein